VAWLVHQLLHLFHAIAVWNFVLERVQEEFIPLQLLLVCKLDTAHSLQLRLKVVEHRNKRFLGFFPLVPVT
jgi:hypothetical protein